MRVQLPAFGTRGAGNLIAGAFLFSLGGHAEGVAFGKFTIVPTGPTTLASEQRDIGFLSNDDME